MGEAYVSSSKVLPLGITVEHTVHSLSAFLVLERLYIWSCLSVHSFFLDFSATPPRFGLVFVSKKSACPGFTGCYETKCPVAWKVQKGFPIHTCANTLSWSAWPSNLVYVILLLLWVIAQPELVYFCFFLHISSTLIHTETPHHARLKQGFWFIPYYYGL